jgi:hypothetical protein
LSARRRRDRRALTCLTIAFGAGIIIALCFSFKFIAVVSLICLLIVGIGSLRC